MKLLLDTHALLWFILDDQRLSAKARAEILSKSNEILVSPASLWEVAIKVSLGKYVLPMAFNKFWEQQLLENQFRLLDIAVPHVAEVSTLPFHHRDPFDRLIIAQARVEDIPVARVDDVFDRYAVERVW